MPRDLRREPRLRVVSYYRMFLSQVDAQWKAMAVAFDESRRGIGVQVEASNAGRFHVGDELLVFQSAVEPPRRAWVRHIGPTNQLSCLLGMEWCEPQVAGAN